MSKKEVAPVNTLPAHLAQYGSAGNESVGVDDIIIPRLGVIQSLSPELDRDSPKYIDGAKAGDLFNSLTREVYPTPVEVVFVDRRKEWVVYRKRAFGGGYRGSFPEESQAQTYVRGADIPAEQLEIVENATNFGLVLTQGAVSAEIVIPMSSTKLKVDRQINSMLRLRGGPRFSSVFLVDTIKEKNDKGTYYNLRANIGPFVTQEVAAAAQKMYDAIHAGQRAVHNEDESAIDSDKF